MFKFLINLIRRKRIILLKGYYIAQVLSINELVWESVSTSAEYTAIRESSIEESCRNRTFEEATLVLYQFLDYRNEEAKKDKIEAREKKIRNKKIVYIAPKPEPKAWRLLKQKDR